MHMLTTIMGATIIGAAAAAGADVDLSELDGVLGLLAWLHNEHRLLYALTTVAVMWICGGALGFFIEHALAAMGWETEELETSE